jgi:RNA polymerase sigma-70 factor (ECF subfamily)
MSERFESEHLRQSFEETALPHLPAVHAMARRLCSGSEEARDLVQETYLRAWRTYQNFRPGTNCRAWLLTILHSVWVNRYRKRLREVPAESLEQLEERFGDAVKAWAAEPPAGWTDPDVEQALAELPEEFRVAVLLVDVEELTYEEAAAAMGSPVGTLRSRLSRARRALFVRLEEAARRARRGHREGPAA